MALERSINSRKITNAAKIVTSAAISPATSGAAGLAVAAEKLANHSPEWLRAATLSAPRSCSRRPLSQSARSTRYWATSGPIPLTRPATGTSANRARPRPSGLPLAAASIRASTSVAAATTAARASIRLYFSTHQLADRSGRVGAVRNSCSRSRNHLAPSVKKTVNTFITPPPAVRAAPLSRSPRAGDAADQPAGAAGTWWDGPAGRQRRGHGRGRARGQCQEAAGQGGRQESSGEVTQPVH